VDIFVENRDRVVQVLQRGECDGVLPAARGFLDGFAGFLLEAGVAYALVHFTLLAFTLLGFYLQETETADPIQKLLTGPPPPPLPERELAVYAGAYFALLRPSELMEIILSHIDAW